MIVGLIGLGAAGTGLALCLAKLMEEDCGTKLQAPGYEGFTYQDRTSSWDRKLKGGRWKPRSKL